MGWLIDLLSGWGGFFTLLFYKETVLMIVAGVGFAAVSVTALRPRVAMVTRLLVIVVAAVIFLVILAAAVLSETRGLID